MITISIEEYCRYCKEEIDMELAPDEDDLAVECVCGAIIEFSATVQYTLESSKPPKRESTA